MILSSGERAVWAAAYFAERRRVMGLLHDNGGVIEMTEVARLDEKSFRSAVVVAAGEVLRLRGKASELTEVFGADNDVILMLRAMLGEE